MGRSYYIILGFFLILAVFWNFMRRKKPARYESEQQMKLQPLPLTFGVKDHLKALFSWIFLFMRLHSLPPGLYFTGASGKPEEIAKTQILVTCNNFLSVFLLARRIRPRSVRILVVDTEGINVWCSAGKGRFSASEILDKARRARLLKQGERTRMILPKFSLSGVRITELEEEGIDPVIGPLYAKDVPAFLDNGARSDRIDDRVHFDFKSRSFTALPTAVQFFLYFSGAYVLLFGYAGEWIIWSAVILAFLYPLLLPYFPGRLFAVKGISMGIIASLIAIALFLYKGVGVHIFLSSVLFLLATSIFIALSCTGNSAISNYSSVRKEIARFLPVVIVLYLLIIPAELLL